MINTIKSAVVGVSLIVGGWLGIYQAPQPEIKTVPQTQEKKVGAFSDPFLSIQVGTSPSNGYYLQTDGTNSSWQPVVGGGGGGGGTFSTSTISGYATGLGNYPNNITDVVLFGSTGATSSAEYWFDPNFERASIGRTSSASTTLMGSAYFPNISQGFTYIGSGGKLNSLASSSILLQDLGGAVTDAQVPDTITVNLAGTATALAANGTNASAGNAILGVDASGNAEGPFDVWTEAENTAAGYVAGTRTLTVAGTANQITSSAGAQDLSANRTWTLSFPNQIIFPQYASSTLGFSTPYASSTFQTIGTLTFGGVTGSAWSTFCTSITGSADLCDGSDASGAGGSSAYEIATTSDIALSQVAYIAKTAGRTTLASVATSSLAVGSSLLSSGTLGNQIGGTNSTLSLNTANANTWTAKQDFFGAASSTLLSANWLKVGATASTTIGLDGSVTTNSTTTTNALQAGSTAIGSNVVKVSPLTGLTTSNSESVGGTFNLNTGTTDTIGMALYNNHTGTNRLLSLVCDAATYGGNCFHVRSDGTVSAVNILGAPTGQGIVKIGSNGAGDADASGLSIDTSLSSFIGQGIFLKGNASGKLLNFRGSDDTEYLTMTALGKLGLASSTPTGARLTVNSVAGDNFSLWVGSTTAPWLRVANDGFGTTTLSGLNISGSATSTSNVGYNITTGCYAISGTCISGGAGGSGDITSVGDVASGAAFDGTQGTTLTFNNAGGDATLDYDGTDLAFSKLVTFPYSSSTIYSSFVTASTTNLIVNGQSFNDLTGDGLTLTSGALTVFSVPASSLASADFGSFTCNGISCLLDNGSVDLTTKVTGTLPIANGGTATTTARYGGLFFYGGDVFRQASTTGLLDYDPTRQLFTTKYSSSTEYASFNTASTTFLRVGLADGCANITSGLLGSTGSACGAGGGGSDPFTHTLFGGQAGGNFFSATTSMMAIGTSTAPNKLSALTVSSSTASQFALSAGAGIAQWTLRNAGGNLYFSTTTVAGSATSTPFFSLLNGGNALFGTTTPWLNSALGVVGTSTFRGNWANLRASTTANTTQTIDWSTGTFQDVMLTGNTSIVVNSTSSNPIDGGTYKLRVCQDGTGSRTLTWANPISLRWWNGTTTITSTANKCTMIGMIFSQTNGNSIYSVVASSTNIDIR